MSTEQDKDSFSLKRNRGGDGGPDGLGGPGVILGSPDKKRRKSNTQSSPSFGTLSEYAPPPNPSSDHLVALNPFDDNYNVPPASLKPPNNPYFGATHYPGFGGYGISRVVPHVQNRMPAPFGPSFQIRNQPHLFPQNPMGLNRAPAFNYENPGFAHHPVFNNSPVLHQHFKPGPGEYVNQISGVIQHRASDPIFAPEPTGCGNRHALKSGLDMSPVLNFAQPTTPKQEAPEKNATPPRKPGHILEDGGAQENQTELRGKNRSTVEAEKINGVLHPQKSPQAGAEHGAERNRRQSNTKTGSAHNKRNRASNSAPSEPVFPCGICLGEVNDDQEAILCEASCQKWFHRMCTGMTETAYNLLTAESDAVWGCDACMDQKDGAQLLKTREGSGSGTANIKKHT